MTDKAILKQEKFVLIILSFYDFFICEIKIINFEFLFFLSNVLIACEIILSLLFYFFFKKNRGNIISFGFNFIPQILNFLYIFRCEIIF